MKDKLVYPYEEALEEEKELEVAETTKPKKETAKKSAAKAEKEEVEIEE